MLTIDPGCRARCRYEPIVAVPDRDVGLRIVAAVHHSSSAQAIEGNLMVVLFTCTNMALDAL